MKIYVRYDMPNEKGKTRRETNEAFEVSSPECIIPPGVHYIWTWYLEFSSCIRRVRDGVCEPFPPTEYIAWLAATGHIVYPWEYAILRAIDGEFCAEMNKELADYQERLRSDAAKNRNNKKGAK